MGRWNKAKFEIHIAGVKEGQYISEQQGEEFERSKEEKFHGRCKWVEETRYRTRTQTGASAEESQRIKDAYNGKIRP